MGNGCSIQQSEKNNCWLEQNPEKLTVLTVPFFLGHPVYVYMCIMNIYRLYLEPVSNALPKFLSYMTGFTYLLCKLDGVIYQCTNVKIQYTCLEQLGI